MAAGIGFRFSGCIKQLELVSLHDEIIKDYSIHDAIEAGFNKIVFAIRKDIEEDFRERIGNRIEELCKKLYISTVQWPCKRFTGIEIYIGEKNGKYVCKQYW